MIYLQKVSKLLLSRIIFCQWDFQNPCEIGTARFSWYVFYGMTSVARLLFSTNAVVPFFLVGCFWSPNFYRIKKFDFHWQKFIDNPLLLKKLSGPGL